MRAVKKLFDKIMSLVFVPKCVGCGARLSHDDILCPKCFGEYMFDKNTKCPSCNGKMSDCTCAPEVMRDMGLSRYIKLLPYKHGEHETTERMLYELKRHRNKKLIDFFATEIALPISKYMKSKPANYVITYCPRTPKEKLKYGFDQSKSVARECARILSVPFEVTVYNDGKKLQKEASHSERVKNAKNSYYVYDDADFSGKTYFLLDDVVTTASTMRTCKNLLKDMGAKDVIAVSLYQAIRFHRFKSTAL
ncbi:MAG: phosphoribosyltransferase family protein [Eubacteriales bacterium]|nr:phosphoribosyltransferase family protein [Eubacteriales bacterium]